LITDARETGKSREGSSPLRHVAYLKKCDQWRRHLTNAEEAEQSPSDTWERTIQLGWRIHLKWIWASCAPKQKNVAVVEWSEHTGVVGDKVRGKKKGERGSNYVERIERVLAFTECCSLDLKCPPRAPVEKVWSSS
jgi:hypothetical protein